MTAQAVLPAKIRWWQLAIAVRILRFVFIEKTTVLLDQVYGAFFASNLAVLRGEHGHFIGILVLLVVVNHGLHGLLVIFAAIVVNRVPLYRDNAWTLAEFTADLESLLNLVFVEAWSAIIYLHLGQATALGPRFRDGAVSILVFLVD
jgi:hypothetical protein